MAACHKAAGKRPGQIIDDLHFDAALIDKPPRGKVTYHIEVFHTDIAMPTPALSSFMNLVLNSHLLRWLFIVISDIHFSLFFKFDRRNDVGSHCRYVHRGYFLTTFLATNGFGTHG